MTRVLRVPEAEEAATALCDGSQGETVDQVNACASTPVPALPCLFLFLLLFVSFSFVLFLPCFLRSSRAPFVHPFSLFPQFSLLLSSRLPIVLRYCVPWANHTSLIVIDSSAFPLASPTHPPPFAQHPLLAGLTVWRNGKTGLARVLALRRYHRLRLFVETTLCVMVTIS